MNSVAAIILAAGASRRLGSPKQLVKVGGETLLERAVRVSAEAGLDPIYGVVTPDLLLDSTPARMIRIDNLEAAEGMASSIRAGLHALELWGTTSKGAIVVACDQPAVTALHLQALAHCPGEVVASRYAGKKGIPAYFPALAFSQLLTLRGDMGARDLLHAARVIDLPGGELDVDTVEDLERARKLFSV